MLQCKYKTHNHLFSLSRQNQEFWDVHNEHKCYLLCIRLNITSNNVTLVTVYNCSKTNNVPIRDRCRALLRIISGMRYRAQTAPGALALQVCYLPTQKLCSDRTRGSPSPVRLTCFAWKPRSTRATPPNQWTAHRRLHANNPSMAEASNMQHFKLYIFLILQCPCTWFCNVRYCTLESHISRHFCA